MRPVTPQHLYENTFDLWDPLTGSLGPLGDPEPHFETPMTQAHSFEINKALEKSFIISLGAELDPNRHTVLNYLSSSVGPLVDLTPEIVK